jgi:hypothetical protein
MKLQLEIDETTGVVTDAKFKVKNYLKKKDIWLWFSNSK